MLQILALLQKVDPTEVEEMVEIKEEPSDPILEGVLEEGKFSLFSCVTSVMPAHSFYRIS